MCGIIALISLTQNNIILTKLLNGLKQLQNRGYDSAGICTIDQSANFNLVKYASTNETDSIKKLESILKDKQICNIGIAHTRWATHGAKTDQNSHPHLSYDGKIAVVHNGIIENYLELKTMLQSKAIDFKSETDTEIISNLLAYEYSQSGDFVEAIKTSLTQLSGTWGLAILNLDQPNYLYCVRHGSPLLVSQTSDMVLVSSEQSGFNGLVNNYFVLDSNDICIISIKDRKLDINTSKKYDLRNASKINFDLSPEPFRHWTLKEINEQYESSLRAISLGGRLLNSNKVRLGGLENYKEILKRIDNLIFLGCGTSYFAALCGTHYFKDLCKFNTIQLYDGAEFTDKDIPLIGNTALVLLSQSGETRDLIRCLKIGKDQDLFTIGIVNVVDSLIARETNCGCYLNTGREVGVASTKSFTNQVILLSMLAVWFSQIHNTSSNKRRYYLDALRKLPYDIKNTVSNSVKSEIYSTLKTNSNSLFILGKGQGEAIAKEGSLKIKELSYIHAEGYSGSSLKHGPFSLLDEDLPVILIAPDNVHYIKMNNVYQEVSSRKSPIVVITDKIENDFGESEDFGNVILVPHNKIFSNLLCVIPLQLIAYNLSVNRGINPDQPKNLAKCVTVE